MLVEGSGAFDGLQDQLLGNAARESHVHARVDQSFGKEKDIRGTAPREGGCHIEIAFIFDKDFLSQRAKDRPCNLLLFLCDFSRGGPNGDAFPDLTGRIGHRTHHGFVFQSRADLLARGTRDNGEDQRVRMNTI